MKKLNKMHIWIAILIGVTTLLLYWPSHNYEFLNYDDNRYVFENPAVTNGISLGSIKWAMSKESVVYTGHWHPLTIISLLLDSALFGVHSGSMHLHSSVMHAINSILIFYFLVFLLGFTWHRKHTHSIIITNQTFKIGELPSIIYMAAAIGATFWAYHPLRVESVAWISSRKDVLSLFWYLFGMITYCKAITNNRDGYRRAIYMGGAIVGVILSFLAKPTAIAFIGTAFVVEYALIHRIIWRRMYALGFLTLIFVIITLAAGNTANVVSKNEIFSLSYRVGNALTAVLHYISSSVYPSKLVCIYPLVVPLPVGPMICGGVLLFLSGFWLYWRVWPIVLTHSLVPPCQAISDEIPIAKTDEDFITDLRVLMAVGFLWFLGALLPVSGLFGQVGCQAYADRYTYLSGVGLSIILATVVVYVSKVLNIRHTVATILFLISMFMLSGHIFMTIDYLEKWKNSETLWSYVMEISPDNAVACINRAAIYYDQKQYDKALPFFCKAAAKTGTEDDVNRVQSVLWLLEKMGPNDNILMLNVKENDPLAAWKYLALGMIAEQRKITGSAENFYQKSVESDASNYLPRMLLGLLLTRMEDREKKEALDILEKALELKPDDEYLRMIVRNGKKILKEKSLVPSNRLTY